MRITFISSSLSKGGAERTVANITAGLADRNNDVSIVTKYPVEPDSYTVSSAVKVNRMPPDPSGRGLLHRFSAAKTRSRNLRTTVLETNPDIVVSFTTKMNVRTLLALGGTDVPVIISERNNPSRACLSPRWQLLRRYTYPHAALLVSLSKGVDNAFSWMDEQKRLIIPNALPPDIFSKATGQSECDLDPEYDWFVATGRLVYQKGFDILIAAFERIHRRIPTWRLAILGDGDRFNELINLIRTKGLENKIIMPGRLTNPFPTMSQASAFILSSRYEGFGNVIIEAMALGVPVISFDCPFGPSEILEHNVSGLLMPREDEHALSDTMLWVAEDPELRASLRVAGQARAKDFELDAVAVLWERAIFTSLQNKRDL